MLSAVRRLAVQRVFSLSEVSGRPLSAVASAHRNARSCLKNPYCSHRRHGENLVRRVAAQPSASMQSITYLSQEEAVKVDEELMGPLGFSVDQLMELAGLSVACALAAEYPLASYGRVLVLAGPGNNGGDGLVAARHLHHFGYSVKVCYPKRTERALYRGLVTQLQSLGIEFVDVSEVLEQPTGALAERYDVLMDALFGFSFRGPPRAPFDDLLRLLAAERPPLVSVDIPSGWHVERGDESGDGLKPELLVSLTTPKRGAASFKGVHYLGGRFVPPEIVERYGLKLPQYPGTAMCVKLSGGESEVSE